MSAFDTYRQMRDSTLRNGENARQELAQENALLARQTAGAQIAGGNLQGGANALLGAGDIAGGMAVSNAYRTGQTQDRERQRGAVLAGASSLLRVPVEQRAAFLQERVVPILREEGLGDEILGAIADDDITDAELAGFITALGGEAPTPYANDRAGPNGSVIRPDATGAYQPVYTPEAPDPTAPVGYRWTDGDVLEAIPGGPADPRQVGAVASSRRAPRQARASGGSGRAPSPRSSGTAPAGRPWERSW